MGAAYVVFAGTQIAALVIWVLDRAKRGHAMSPLSGGLIGFGVGLVGGAVAGASSWEPGGLFLGMWMAVPGLAAGWWAGKRLP